MREMWRWNCKLKKNNSSKKEQVGIVLTNGIGKKYEPREKIKKKKLLAYDSLN